MERLTNKRRFTVSITTDYDLYVFFRVLRKFLGIVYKEGS